MKGVREFFACSDLLDLLALRQLSHINGNWELSWDSKSKEYVKESNSFAEHVNHLIDELCSAQPPERYHDNEDCLAEFAREKLNWDLQKVGGRWIGADYPLILEQGAFGDVDQQHLLLAVAGRIKAAIDRGQSHFDDMEDGHRKVLADVFAVILYHRADTEHRALLEE